MQIIPWLAIMGMSNKWHMRNLQIVDRISLEDIVIRSRALREKQPIEMRITVSETIEPLKKTTGGTDFIHVHSILTWVFASHNVENKILTKKYANKTNYGIGCIYLIRIRNTRRKITDNPKEFPIHR